LAALIVKNHRFPRMVRRANISIFMGLRPYGPRANR
jgi:hypothetical protein